MSPLGHDHAPKDFGKAFATGIGLNLVYVILETGFGLYSGSLALVADAGHNLSDVLAAGMGGGLAFGQTSQRPSDLRFKRSPILASLANGTLLMVAVGAIGWEAIRRLLEPQQVASFTVVWVAVAGVLVNGVTAWLFASGSENDLNIRGAFLHMAADTGVTMGVIGAALLIHWTGWIWLDPAVSLLIAAVVLIGTWGLLRSSAMLIIDAVPAGIDLEAVHEHIVANDAVDDVHDLHIWALSTTETALTAHLVCSDQETAQHLLVTLPPQLRERFGVGHSTLQIETPDTAQNCSLRFENVV